MVDKVSDCLILVWKWWILALAWLILVWNWFILWWIKYWVELFKCLGLHGFHVLLKDGFG
jgi:hypothetical protein